MVSTAVTSHRGSRRNEAPVAAASTMQTRLFAVLICVSVAPLLANVVFLISGTTFGGIDPTPFTLALGLVGLTWLVCANHAADTVSAATPPDAVALRRVNRTLDVALAHSQNRLAALSARCAELERELTIDPLTGVHNRRGLEAAFGATMDRTAGDTVMALLDIDHFKTINDTWGHATGDRVLKDFARLLRARLNDSLPIYRVGGEEFVILFPRAQSAEVAALLDRFRSDLQLDTFTRMSDRIPVSFSAGLALGREAGSGFGAGFSGGFSAGFSDVFGLADDRLYAAKSAGRARTVWHDAGACDKVAAAG